MHLKINFFGWIIFKLGEHFDVYQKWNSKVLFRGISHYIKCAHEPKNWL